MAIENHSSVRQLVRRTLDAPADAREAVPALLDALDDAEPTVRAGVAWAICAVAVAHPEDAPGIVRRLEERRGHTAAMAAGWIRREFDVEAAGRESADLPVPEQSSHEDGAEDASGPIEPRAAATRPERSSSRSKTDDRSETPSGGPIRERTDEVVQDGNFTIQLDRTALDSLEIVDRIQSDRHSWTYAGIAGVDARRRAVLVRSYRLPQGARHSTFVGPFEDVVTDWQGIDDHDHVLSVYDFGRRPHPWVVTEYAPETLGTVGRLSVPAALRVGLGATKGLGHAHERSVTHRSLDPRSIALDSEDGTPIARLANVGIVEPFRAVSGPLPLDSRYAAPELFDHDHGGVDWLTDVYHLGAVLYTAFTGRPPYQESLVERGGPAGLSYEPPSSVDESVPVAVDRIVAKAMATHKIARYEGTDEFARDLQSALAAIEDA